MNILFLHGWQSTPGGVKPTYWSNLVEVGTEHQLADEEALAAMLAAVEKGDSGLVASGGSP